MFEQFEKRKVAVEGAELNVRIGGEGPPLLLLHGYPQTHVAWHLVAPQLRDNFCLVTPDLRGYGGSKGPPADAQHVNYSKRAMAQDCVQLMEQLGHESFGVAGHDRGGRVGYRLALDHPNRVTRFAALDIVPTLVVWERMNQSAALSTVHWPFLAQPKPLPERMIGHDPDFWFRHLFERWLGEGNALDPAALSEYLKQFHDPHVLEASCEDYRAGATVDLDHDRADRDAGHRIGCPTLVIWSRQYLKSRSDDVLSIWRDWAEDVSDVSLDCGHFLAEEEPDACASALREFFGR